MKKIFLALAAVVLFLACCEGAARIAYRLSFHRPYQASEIEGRITAELDKKTPQKAKERGSSGRAHPYYGFVTKDDHPLSARRGFKDMTASQLGFTGDTPLFDPSGKTFLVVITGGSVANYFASAKAGELLSWLAKRPEFAGRSGRLINVALPGYKQPQQLLILSDLLATGVRPDVVINLDGFNEACIARKNLDVGVYPFMPWFWGSEDAPSREHLRLLGRMDFLESLRGETARFLSRLPALPAIIGFPAAALDNLVDSRIGKIEFEMARAKGIDNPLARQRVSRNGGYYLGPGVVVTQGQFARLAAGEWARASILMNDMTRAAGGRYFHALQPTEPLWAAARGQVPGPICTETCVDSGYPDFIHYGEVLAASGLRFANLDSAMTATANAFKDCCHVTPAGQDALFSGMTAFLERTWNNAAPAVDPNTALTELEKKTSIPFAGADLMATPEPGSIAVENLRGTEHSGEGYYRTTLGREVAICLPLDTARKLTIAFGLKNLLPGQAVSVRLNDRELGYFPLDKPDARLEKTLEAQFGSGLNTLSFIFKKTNTGPDRNKDMPEGCAVQFTALSLTPVP